MMGSWNATCFVTRLPIGYGDPVRLITVAGRARATMSRTELSGHGASPANWLSGLCYPDDVLRPVVLPVRAHYDGYGGADEFVDEPTTAILGAWMRGRTTQVYDACPTDDIAGYVRAAERGVLETPAVYPVGAVEPVGVLHVRDDVYRAMIPLGLDNRDEVVDGAYGWFGDPYGRTDRPGEFFNHTVGAFEIWVVHRWVEKHPEHLDAAVQSLTDWLGFRAALKRGRIGILPPAGSGSQDGDLEVHHALARIVLESSVSDDLPALGQRVTGLPDIRLVRDIELFEHPVLSEYRDEHGVAYVEKFCTRADGVWRTLVVRSDRESIDAYIAGEISLHELLVERSGGIGYLCDTDGPGRLIRVAVVDVRSLPAEYLPDPDVYHDPALFIP